MKEIKVEWCENWLKKTFGKLSDFATGIERTYLFKMAERSGLYIKGTYGSSFSMALLNLTTIEFNGKYYIVKLK